MKVDYIRMMQEYFGIRNEGFLTDNPMSIKLSDDDYIKVRYDAKAMRWTVYRFAEVGTKTLFSFLPRIVAKSENPVFMKISAILRILNPIFCSVATRSPKIRSPH